MLAEIREQLFAQAEESYRAFSSSLLPGHNNLLGVRLPILRKMAREIACGDWRAFLAGCPDEYFEEVMLQGMVIGCAQAPPSEILSYTAAFVPKIDNWSVCDSFCTGFALACSHASEVWAFLQPYFLSSKEFEVRFAVVMLRCHFLNAESVGRALELLDTVRQPGYYAQMAVAWAVASCYPLRPGQTLRYLQSGRPADSFTRRKSLQKIIESRLVCDADKALFRAMRQQEYKKRKDENPA